nr:MAG TPA: Cytosine specific methyltransferase [Caudoviricetes sp.]
MSFSRLRALTIAQRLKKSVIWFKCLPSRWARFGQKKRRYSPPELTTNGEGGNMIYASVCSGVEAASLAWIPLGWKAAWFSEIEPFPCAVLKHRFPEVPNLGDMTKIKVETIENETGKLQRFKNESGADVVVPGGVDLLVGGTPCQSFSFAGNRSGLRGVSGLALTYCELLETMRPRWFVWENVPGVFSANQGDDFRTFLRKIDEIGYSVAWRVLDAQYVRVDGYPRAIPQRRRRVFVVGYFGSDFRCPAGVLFEPESVFRTTPPRRSKGSGVARCLTASTGGASGKEQQHTFISGDGRPLNAIKVIATGQANAETVTDLCVNLTCNHEAPIVCGYETGQGYWQSGDIAGTLRAEGENRPSRPSNIICGQAVSVNTSIRRLLPVECERLMGFPDNWTRIPWRSKPEEECPDSHRYKACGNSMCVNVMRWIGMRIELTERKLK